MTGERAGRGPLVLSCSEGRRGRHAGGAARWLGGPATAKGSAQKPTGGQIFQASHAAPKLGRHIRLVTRNKVVGSLGPDGRLKFLSAVAAFDRNLADESFRKRFGSNADGLTCAEMLKSLFHFSILAFQKTGGVGGGSEYVWRYNDPSARYDDTARFFRCHPGLIESLGLKQWAKSMESE